MSKRVCILSFRTSNTHVSRCNDYEFEDVITSVEDADLFTIEQKNSFSLRKRLVNQSTRHISPFFASISPSTSCIRLDKTYDLFIAVCEDITDILSVSCIENWRDQCGTAICWVDEAWAADLHSNRRICNRILSKFDYVATGANGSINGLQELVDAPVSYIPPGVDALRFAPKIPDKKRSIGIYSIGRRPAKLHENLLSFEESRGIHYLYDSVSSTLLYVDDYRTHRKTMIRNLQDSRYFMVYPSKFDAPEQTRGQVEFGFRYFEGAAAGTVLIGQIPDSDEFNSSFDWHDAVIELPDEPDALYQLLDQLEADSKRVEAIRKRNIRECLLRHDWSNRWQKLISLVDLEPTREMVYREHALRARADLFRNAETDPVTNSVFVSHTDSRNGWSKYGKEKDSGDQRQDARCTPQFA